MDEQTFIFLVLGALAIVWFIGVWTGWVTERELVEDARNNRWL